jgi:hypothetical protein
MEFDIEENKPCYKMGLSLPPAISDLTPVCPAEQGETAIPSIQPSYPVFFFPSWNFSIIKITSNIKTIHFPFFNFQSSSNIK